MQEYAKKRAIPIDYVDKDQNPRTVYVVPREIPSVETPTEAQTMAEAVVGFCSGCHAQCTMTFPGGFDHASLDQALHGKPVKAICPRCEKLTEFLPAHKYMNHPAVMRNQPFKI